jgi:2-keto-4-pentenoate hydratase/2-oxohepta-3-ene-1,7-dioic acid hydratase in catechol pathway
MQDANTSTMIYDVATIISYLSEFTPLRPGDVIATGTPAGVGFKRKPPRFLQPGDRLHMEISGVGVLENRVEDEVADAIAPLLRRRQS